MRTNQVAAQLYTIRNFIKTPEDIAASMKRIREIGYTSVQISGMGPIDESEMVRILAGEGLTCCATHEKTATILDTPELIVERLQKLNCTYTAIPSPGGIDLSTIASVKDYARRANHAGKVLADSGLVLTYHNHNIEFRRVEGALILDILYNETDPAYLQGEIDTYWVQAGGGDPTSWCRRLKNRLPLLHMKDFGLNIENKPVFKEIGYGNLDWKAIVAASEESGCSWFIVEQDGGWADDDPFKSLQMSYEFIAENLCS